jgi:hypothetical protein
MFICRFRPPSFPPKGRTNKRDTILGLFIQPPLHHGEALKGWMGEGVKG